MDEFGHKSSQQLRKINKPIMERKRRERINRSLSELKRVLLAEPHPDPCPRPHSKLEKADILEHTVKHLKTLRRHTVTAPMSSSLHYQAGYSRCVQEASIYLSQVGSDHKAQALLHHLTVNMPPLAADQSRLEATSPTRVISPTSLRSPIIRVSSPTIRVSSPTIRVSSPPIRVSSPCSPVTTLPCDPPPSPGSTHGASTPHTNSPRPVPTLHLNPPPASSNVASTLLCVTPSPLSSAAQSTLSLTAQPSILAASHSTSTPTTLPFLTPSTAKKQYFPLPDSTSDTPPMLVHQGNVPGVSGQGSAGAGGGGGEDDGVCGDGARGGGSGDGREWWRPW